MPQMDISTLKDALGDEKFAALEAFVSDLAGQRDAARKESIEGRKKLREDLASAQATAAKAMEKLGIETPDDLETLPDAKGQAEALKQYETRLKRAERERDEAKRIADEASGKFRNSLQRAAVAEAMQGHEFIARDIVETHIAQRLTWEGDDLLFKSEDGSLLSVKDGVSAVAKSRPELLKPAGAGGAGLRQSNAGSAGGKTISEAEFNARAPKERAQLMASGYTLTPS